MNDVFTEYFYPRTICIAGASSKKGSLGYELANSVINYGYTGKLLLVNPKVDEIFGIKCFKNIEEIEDKIDLAIVMVPKLFVEESIKQLLDKKVRALILITAGFKETGNEGEKLEKKITKLVKNSGARLVGPNCMGIINTINEIKLNATFVAEKPENGTMAFLSQSGAIGAAVLNSLRETDIRFSHFISVGNKADVNENDLMDFWESDENVGVITLYIESFVDGESFIKKFSDNKITKPTIVLKAGRTSSGIKAASSHTGALGSSDKVVDAVLKQFGILRADSLNDLFNTAKGFENFPLPKGNRIAILTNAGGPAILTVDTLEKNSLRLAELSEETQKTLREIVHPAGSVNNPVDLLPGGTAEQYKQVNEILTDDKNVDGVISIFVEPVMVKALPVIEKINSIESKKPILQVVMPLPEFWNEYRNESETRKPLFRFAEDPAVVLSNMLKFHQHKLKYERSKPGKLKISFKENEDRLLSQEEVMLISRNYKLPIVENLLIDAHEIEKFELDFPLVLKALHSKIVHKTDLQGVILNIQNKKELLEQSKKMQKNFSKRGIKVERFLIQPYLTPKFELLIGGFRDPSFGPMIMFGSGGKYVEQLNDTSIKSAYLSDNDIDEIIGNTKIGHIIKGVRGEKSVDISAVKSTIKSVAQMIIDNQEISECDLNPLLICEDNKMFAVDIRIKVKS